MVEIMRQKTEYGGFLPLELNPGKEWFAEWETNICRFNSVKAAMYFLIKNIKPARIYLPYYYCPSTTEAIRQLGIELEFYHICEGLTPINIPDMADSLILLVDYFGVISEKIKIFAQSFNKATIIIDNAHSFFTKPLFVNNIHMVYSAKKFFGVPDGAYLISKKYTNHSDVSTFAHDYSGYLLKTYEEGTNAAYQQKKDVDKYIAEHMGGMSILAQGILKNVDYCRVQKQRENNFSSLYRELKKYNALGLPEKCAAYQFPFLIKEVGRKIKKALIDNKIFVSTLWAGNDLLLNGNEFELCMSNDAVFLPVDQRYSEEDMKYIAYMVKRCLE